MPAPNEPCSFVAVGPVHGVVMSCSSSESASRRVEALVTMSQPIVVALLLEVQHAVGLGERLTRVLAVVRALVARRAVPAAARAQMFSYDAQRFVP